MAYARKTDSNQRELVEALRGVGARVLILGGKIDVAVLYHGCVTLIDAKNLDGRNRLTDTQVRLVAEGWPIVFIHSVEEALAAVKGVEVQ